MTRVTTASAPQRIEFIDFARGFAMSTVILMHAFMDAKVAPLISALISFGGAGVHLFIFLSGFALANARQVPVADFFKRRLIKIVIPYYICITTIFILNSFFHLYKSTVRAYLGHIFFYKMFNERIVSSFGSHFWFISTIIQLYVIYPLLMWCMRRFGKAFFLAGCFAISVAWWIWLAGTDNHQRIYNSFFLQYLWEFALGMVVAQMYQHRGRAWDVALQKIVVVGVISLGLYGALSVYGSGWGKDFNDIPALLGYGCVCVICYRSLKSIPDAKRVMNFVGRHSYMIYLWHGLVLRILCGYK